MRLSSRAKSSQKMELSMTSMIDVVFLLLIFFITTSSIIRSEKSLNPAIKLQQPGGAKRDLAPAVVSIEPGGGGFVYKVGANEVTTPEELTGILRNFDNKLDGATILGHDDAPYEMAAKAIQACKLAQFHKVTYAPLQK